MPTPELRKPCPPGGRAAASSLQHCSRPGGARWTSVLKPYRQHANLTGCHRSWSRSWRRTRTMAYHPRARQRKVLQVCVVRHGHRRVVLVGEAAVDVACQVDPVEGDAWRPLVCDTRRGGGACGRAGGRAGGHVSGQAGGGGGGKVQVKGLHNTAKGAAAAAAAGAPSSPSDPPFWPHPRASGAQQGPGGGGGGAPLPGTVGKDAARGQASGTVPLTKTKG